MSAARGRDGSIRIATRGSALARAQAQLVADALAVHGVATQFVIVQTEGDRRAPDTAWGEGAFVTAIERAVLAGEADLAVHSAKDVPTEEDPALRVVAYLPREDPRDALVIREDQPARTIDSLPAAAVVGTDSPRRTGFLRARRADLDVRPLHGNVDTRLQRLDAGEVDALVLAVAGLVRLGRADRIAERIAAEALPPAPGQGAICVQVRAADRDLVRLGDLVDDPPTRVAVEAERAFLSAAGGGCRAPIGALAEMHGDRLHLLGGFATVDGSATAMDSVDGPAADGDELARELAARLGSRRARLSGGRRVLVTRPGGQSGSLVARLAEQGLEGVVVPAIEVELAPAGGALDAEMARIDAYDWGVLTSANGARAAAASASRVGVDLSSVRWAAVGGATARHLRKSGVPDAWQPTTATGEALGAELPVSRGQRALVVRGSLAGDALSAALRNRGTDAVEVVAYTTIEAPASSRPLLERALAGGPVAAMLLASPSAVRGIVELAGEDLHAAVLALPAICIGPTTAAAARDAGLTVLGQAERQDDGAVAELAAEVLAREMTGAGT